MVSITVSDPDKPTLSPAPVYGPPRPVRNMKQEAYDEMRRPQAAVLYRALMAATSSGLSWKDCWALGEGNEQWNVGPIVVWLRSHSVDIEAVYDVVAGETRFYLTLWLRGGTTGP